MNGSQPAQVLREARVAEALTVAWMVAELVIAISAGLAARSVALTTFGIDSGVELVTALVVLRQLLLIDGSRTIEELDRIERGASRFAGWALRVLIVYIVVTSALSFIVAEKPEASSLGLGVALAAAVVMPVLWRWKQRLAGRLDNPALRADAASSLVCGYLSATLLLGLLANRLFGWWWADPVAALFMLPWIWIESREALEAAYLE